MKKSITLSLALLTWFAVIGQFVTMLMTNNTPLLATLIFFLGFFTIQTNILVALALTILSIHTNHRIGQFFSHRSTLTAITVYILVTGLIYNIILRGIWHPVGFQKIVDEMLHVFVPLATVIWWFLFVAPQKLSWKNIWPWLIYPVVYFSFTMGYGFYAERYPYPFMDVAALGYGKVIANGLMVLSLFLLLSLCLVGISKLVKQSDSK